VGLFRTFVYYFIIKLKSAVNDPKKSPACSLHDERNFVLTNLIVLTNRDTYLFKFLFNTRRLYFNLPSPCCWCPNILLLKFSFEVLQKLPLCEKIPHEKSHINIVNGNQYIGDLIFWVFLTVNGSLRIFGDANLTVHSLMQKEYKCFEISRLSFIVHEIKAFYCLFFIFNSAQQQCHELT
jgi:hypothetical protein